MDARVVGGYQLERLLGGGTFGQVWLGRHVETRGVAAVKLLREQARLDEQTRRLFEREVRIIARLTHPNIVPFYDCGGDFLITKYVAGTSLRKRLERGISFDDALRIAAQIGSALQHAHQRGVVHRDVKPANIILDDNDNAYLIDFGVAALVDSGEPTEQAGTPGFAAPEQFRPKATITGQADQFGLARTVAAMLTGETRPPEERLDQLPADLRAILDRATADAPEERWPDVAALVAALQQASEPQRTKRPLAEPRRDPAPYRWMSDASESQSAGPGLAMTSYRLSALVEAGALPRAAVEELLDRTGYADMGWSVFGSVERLGPLTSPESLARARRVFVLIHGLLCAREVWSTVAPRLVTHNPDALVLTPDIGGFGASPWRDRVRDDQLQPGALATSTREWLRLIGLGTVPTVLVGHSISAVSLMCTSDDQLPGTTRVAIAPTFAFCDAAYRKRMSRAATLLSSFGRIGLMRRVAAVRMIRRGEETNAYTDDVKSYFIRRSHDVRAPVLARQLRGLVRAKPVRGSEARGCAVVLTANDPLAPPQVVNGALAALEFPATNVHRFAQGGHFPHCEVQGRPEWTTRNIDEMVAILGDLGRGSPNPSPARTPTTETTGPTVTVDTL